MKPGYMLSEICDRCKAGILKLGATIGLIIMMASNGNAAPAFKLKSPQDYFADSKTLALLNAALAGSQAQAEQLVADGANPNDEGPRDNQYNRLRLLHYALAANNGQALRILISVGADPEMDAEGFGPALLFAMTLDNVGMLSLLLDLRPIDRISKGTLKSILFESVNMPRPRCLELLLNRGAPIDLPNSAGYTIMMQAMDAQDYDLAEWLLSRGASVHIEAYDGSTPANSVQFHLQKFKPGSPAYNKALHLKALMEARGAIFPALSPKEVKARRAATTGK